MKSESGSRGCDSLEDREQEKQPMDRLQAIMTAENMTLGEIVEVLEQNGNAIRRMLESIRQSKETMAQRVARRTELSLKEIQELEGKLGELIALVKEKGASIYGKNAQLDESASKKPDEADMKTPELDARAILTSKELGLMVSGGMVDTHRPNDAGVIDLRALGAVIYTDGGRHYVQIIRESGEERLQLEISVNGSFVQLDEGLRREWSEWIRKMVIANQGQNHGMPHVSDILLDQYTFMDIPGIVREKRPQNGIFSQTIVRTSDGALIAIYAGTDSGEPMYIERR